MKHLVQTHTLLVVGSLCALSFFLLGAATPFTVTWLLNGESRGPLVGARLEGGHLVAPVRPLVTALGGEAYYDARQRTLEVFTPSPWFDITHTFSFATTFPFETRAMGAILTVRHSLAEAQWASLNATDKSEPILARYEIIDAASRVNPPFDLPSRDLPGFTIRAVLYWVYLDPQGPPRASTRIFITPDGGFNQDGPQITKVRAEVVDYDLLPKDAAMAPPADTWTKAELLGGNGWTITAPTTRSSCQIDRRGKENIIPMYDLSAAKLPEVKSVLCPGFDPGAPAD